MYAVFGATGNTGSVVARELLKRKARVRALVRDANKAEPLRAQGAELVVVREPNAEQFTAVLSGVQGAYVMLPPRADSEDMLSSGRELVDAIASAVARASVPHVVFLSSIGAHLPEGTGPILSNRYGEQVLRRVASGLTLLRPPYFMENWAESLHGLAQGELGSMLALDHGIPMIATEDIGRVAASLLLEGAKGQRVVELSGPRSYTPRDVAGALSALLGREIAAEALPNQAIPGVLTSVGMSARNAELFREMHAGIDNDSIQHEGGGAQQFVGTTPLEDVLKRHLTV